MHTTIPSRRALLAGAPAVAAAALAGGTAANAVAIGMAKADEVDPIFAAIEAHRATVDLILAIEDRSNNEDLDEVGEEIDDQMDAAIDTVIEADLVLLSTSPTTVAGVVAALEYAGSVCRHQREPTILQGANGWADVEIKKAARDFPALMGAALRNIIARGQA
jgi:hypothetical protein